MPNKKKKTNAKSRRPKQPPRLTKTTGQAKMSSAAAAQSGFRKSSVSFEKGTGGGGIIMTSTAAMFEIGARSTGTPEAGLRNGSGVYGSSAQLNLTNPGGTNEVGVAIAMPFISPQWDLIASCFSRFRVLGCEFEYFPQCSTSNVTRLVFAYSSDPIHPLIFDATPTQAELESVADSIPFSPWAAWKMNVTSKVNKEWFYTYDGLAAAAPSSVNSYVERFASFGIVGCISANAAAAEVDGLLYLTLKIEFCEFNPISVTRPALLERLHRKITEQAKDRFKRTNGLDKGKFMHLAQIAGSFPEECECTRWRSPLEREVSSSTHTDTTDDTGTRKEEDEEMERWLARKLARKEQKLRADLAKRWSAMFAKGKYKDDPHTQGAIESLDESEESDDRTFVDNNGELASGKTLRLCHELASGGVVTPSSPTIDSISDSELGRIFVQRRLAARARGSDTGSPPSNLGV
jgi:hypothetical protein